MPAAYAARSAATGNIMLPGSLRRSRPAPLVRRYSTDWLFALVVFTVSMVEPPPVTVAGLKLHVIS